jgi:hypothetical protein
MRIGMPAIPIDPEKIVAVVESRRPDITAATDMSASRRGVRRRCRH